MGVNSMPRMIEMALELFGSKRSEDEELELLKTLEFFEAIAKWLNEHYGDVNVEMRNTDNKEPLAMTLDGPVGDVEVIVEMFAVQEPDDIAVKREKGETYLEKIYSKNPMVDYHTAEGIYYSHGKRFDADMEYDDYKLAPGIRLVNESGWEFVLIVTLRDSNSSSSPQQSASAIAIACSENVRWKDIEPYVMAIDDDVKKDFGQRTYRSIVFY